MIDSSHVMDLVGLVLVGMVMGVWVVETGRVEMVRVDEEAGKEV